MLRKQPMMRKVLAALLPCAAGAVYFFGWRSLAMIVVSCVAAFAAEWFFCRKRKETVSEACFVTAVLYALVMPPNVGWHILIIGVVFAIVFSKEVFGGFGRNFFNPALAGRCFVYICFPYALTGLWAPADQGLWGALDKWTTVCAKEDVITGATPMGRLKAGELVIDDKAVQTADWQKTLLYSKNQTVVKVPPKTIIEGLFFGRIAGTMGVTSVLLICIGGVYLFWTKTANRTIILSTIISYFLMNEILYLAGLPGFYGGLYPLLGGGFLFGAFYMATDPVSSPKTTPARIIYGIIIGVCTTVIRNFSIFNGGLMFSILIGNMFASILDYAVEQIKNRVKTAPIGEAG